MEELKKCPLCGGEVEIYDFAGYEVLCECGISYMPDRPISETKEETIKVWNKRFDIKCSHPDCNCAVKCND